MQLCHQAGHDAPTGGAAGDDGHENQGHALLLLGDAHLAAESSDRSADLDRAQQHYSAALRAGDGVGVHDAGDSGGAALSPAAATLAAWVRAIVGVGTAEPEPRVAEARKSVRIAGPAQSRGSARPAS